MTGKIMVVDDDAATRRMVCNALSSNGHDVIEAADGHTALELMKTERPRVVLQDLRLPDTDGYQLVGELRRLAHGTNVSILAFSGFASDLDEARISRVGFDDLIAKPIAPSRLVPLIEAHLRSMPSARQGPPQLPAGPPGELENEHARVGHVLALARTLDERAAVQRRATERAAVLDALFDSAPDHVAWLDLDGTIRMVNRPRFEPPSAGVVGGNVFSHAAGDHAIALRKALAQIAQTGEPQGFDVSVVHPDGSQMWYSTRLGPIVEDGKVTGAVVVSRDVTAQKQAEMHTILSDRMASVGTLAAGVAHEINNPLASVIANLDMALQDVAALAETAELPPDLSEELKDARAAADRVREIVRDLRIFSRNEDDRRGPVDVEHVLESTLRMAWNELRHRARLVKRFSHVPPVDAHESRLGQVFLNLIVNAAHAIPPGSYDANEIRIATSLDPAGRVVVDIRDTGTGIPPEIRPRLFTPFFSTKPIGVGTSLGLAISHRIVTQFGGTITYDTEVGKGTEFHVVLPVAAAATPQAAQQLWPRMPAARRGNLLVIDDEESLALVIRRFLSVEHNVTAVYRARDALDLLELGTRYDVILCDLMMPQLTGMELHGEVLRIDPAQASRIVFLTGGGCTPAAREFLAATSSRRIEKPFDLKDVRRLVNELIR